MAELVARDIAGGAIGVRVEVDPNAPYPPEHHLPLDTARIATLDWQPTADLETMYRRLIAYLDANLN